MDKNDRHFSATFDRRIAHVGATAQAPEHLSAIGVVCFAVTVFGVSITHLQLETQMDPLPSQPITDK
ncbi:hypothetical protein JET14_21560 (plasmid) [Martelella lutilitoris]|uniref:Uncharacterized protein n=1 Tax=Martelella lutilitoris TaxID=2583532 RepID=A0A7T7KNN9_9HYPH|nr:hypothetical protein [Martelella lutilitoris]QQM33051.1 hypothetical protein JET14_21560 [Martelella lutilitoris]